MDESREVGITGDVENVTRTENEAITDATGIAVEDFGASLAGPRTNKDGSERKKPGRKPGFKAVPKEGGTGTSNEKTPRALDLKGLENILLSMHMMLAIAAKAPELALTSDEAKAQSASIQTVLSFYPTSVISPVNLAWLNLIIVNGGIYGTRIFAIRERKRNERTPQTEQPLTFSQENVTPMSATVKPMWPNGGMPPS